MTVEPVIRRSSQAVTLRELREARDALLSGAAEPGPKPRKPAIMIDLRAVRGAAS